MTEETTIRVQVGALIRRHLRVMLESERFEGASIRWLEDKRWTTSVFHIRGRPADIERVGSRIQHWLKCIGASR